MPRIRFLQSVVGDDVGDRSAGDEADVSTEVAKVWADGVRAELVRAEPVQRPERRRRRETAKG
ncbi:hypothetical protein [Actinomadura alba]|uniref:Uncharacterized protein n=1 Tax=Actinomadura alba TaxID=406431 RepID=A0ABR7LID3_9ACTN|nr:hypothetical protein [Actinomadura alba]MBC6464260.1 hypothetical protein [Actinomadura alba]